MKPITIVLSCLAGCAGFGAQVKHDPLSSRQTFADLGLPEWLMDFEQSDVTKMLATLMDIHDHYDEALLKVCKAMNLVEGKWASTTQVIRRLINA